MTIRARPNGPATFVGAGLQPAPIYLRIGSNQAPPEIRSRTGATANRRLCTGGIVSTTPETVGAGDWLHHHPWKRHKQKIERFPDGNLIICQCIYSGNPQRRSLAGASYPQNPHIGGIWQTSEPTEFTCRWSDGSNAFYKIRTRRIGLCKFVWVWHGSHALFITRTKRYDQATNLYPRLRTVII